MPIFKIILKIDYLINYISLKVNLIFIINMKLFKHSRSRLSQHGKLDGEIFHQTNYRILSQLNINKLIILININF